MPSLQRYTMPGGARDYPRARALSFQVCKIGTLLVFVFALPLALEVDEVLQLWLKEPPKYAAGMCLFVMGMTIVDRLSEGHRICVNANGKVALYQIFVGTSLILSLPLAWFLVVLGCGVYSVGWAMVSTIIPCALGRVWLARKLVGMSFRHWLKSVCLPLLLIVVACFLVGLLPRLFFVPSLLRVCTTTLFVEIVLLPAAWFLLLDSSERTFIWSKMPFRMMQT